MPVAVEKRREEECHRQGERGVPAAEVQGMWERPERRSMKGQGLHLEGLVATPTVGRSARTPCR